MEKVCAENGKRSGTLCKALPLPAVGMQDRPTLFGRTGDEIESKDALKTANERRGGIQRGSVWSLQSATKTRMTRVDMSRTRTDCRRDSHYRVEIVGKFGQM